MAAVQEEDHAAAVVQNVVDSAMMATMTFPTLALHAATLTGSTMSDTSSVVNTPATTQGDAGGGAVEEEEGERFPASMPVKKRGRKRKAPVAVAVSSDAVSDVAVADGVVDIDAEDQNNINDNSNNGDNEESNKEARLQ